MSFSRVLKPEPSIAKSNAPHSSQMRDHDHHVAAVEKLALSLMFAPEIKIVTLFLVAFRNRRACNLAARADGSLMKDDLAFANCDLVAA